MVVIMVHLTKFKDKKVLVTGSTGFKGAWLCLWLKELGADVVGYALEPYNENSLFSLCNLEQQIKQVIGDVRDVELLKSTVAEYKPDIVFHLAAQALLRKSYAEPGDTFGTNVMGAVNILEAVRAVKSVKSLVFVTSDKCYLNKEWTWGYRETDELGGTDPYSASKACAELVFKAYFKSYFADNNDIGIATVRAGNVIGGGDRSTDRIVPDIVNSIETGSKILIRSPNATRPWQHVLDPLYGYMQLALELYDNPSKLSGESFNFGPEQDSIQTVKSLVDLSIKTWGKGEVEYDNNQHHPHEATLLKLSIDKVRFALGWRPLYDFNTAVEKTISWYKEVFEGGEVMKITQAQIRNFMDNIK